MNLNFMAFIKGNIYLKKDGAYIINFDQCESVGSHWIALYENAENVNHFDRFVVEHIPKGIKKFIENKNITTIIYKLQAYGSVMCGYICIGLIDFILKGKYLLEYRYLFSSNIPKKNGKILLKYLQHHLNQLKCIVMFAINTENLKQLKHHIFLKKHYVFLLFTVSVVMNTK